MSTRDDVVLTVETGVPCPGHKVAHRITDPGNLSRLFIIVYPTIKKSTLVFALPQGYSAVPLVFSPEIVDAVLITHLPISDSSQVPASFATDGRFLGLPQ